MPKKSIVLMGATGAVGTQALKALLNIPEAGPLTTLGRRPVPGIAEERVTHHNIDVSDPYSYANFLAGHQVAICTLGVGQPSKVSRADFLKIDKEAVITFGKACKKAQISHFQLLSSVGIDSASSSFFLRSKGELVEELQALEFGRLSIFQPSMILTPTNRYGFLQGVTLKVWPMLHPLMPGGLKKYRGIEVARLGKAFAKNVFTQKVGMESLTWEDFQALTKDRS